MRPATGAQMIEQIFACEPPTPEAKDRAPKSKINNWLLQLDRGLQRYQATQRATLAAIEATMAPRSRLSSRRSSAKSTLLFARSRSLPCAFRSWRRCASPTTSSTRFGSAVLRRRRRSTNNG